MFEKQYFSSQMITSAIMFLTNGDTELGSQGESSPSSSSTGRTIPNSQANGPASVQLAQKGSLKLKQMAASTHSIVTACNRVSYTYVTTHFLI